MKISVVCAMEEEIRTLLTKLEDVQEHTVAGNTFYKGQLYGHEVTFVESGIGKVQAGMTTAILLAEEKPDVVITTGVLAMIPLCLIAKLFGKKLIYIESFAKVSSPTETGRFLYKFADRFYVQWKPMLQFYPKAIYLGGIY